MKAPYGLTHVKTAGEFLSPLFHTCDNKTSSGPLHSYYTFNLFVLSDLSSASLIKISTSSPSSLLDSFAEIYLMLVLRAPGLCEIFLAFLSLQGVIGESCLKGLHDIHKRLGFPLAGVSLSNL